MSSWTVSRSYESDTSGSVIPFPADPKRRGRRRSSSLTMIDSIGSRWETYVDITSKLPSFWLFLDSTKTEEEEEEEKGKPSLSEVNTNAIQIDVGLKIDPLPDRSHHYHWSLQNPPLLRAQAKGKRHRSLLWRTGTHPYALATDRVLCGTIRHHDTLWRLLGHHCSVCEERARRGTVHWHGNRSDGHGAEEERRIARII